MNAPKDVDPSIATVGTVFDESAVEIARTYASAFVAAAGAGAAEAVDELEQILDDVFAAQPKFAELLYATALSPTEKDRVLAEVFEGRASAVVLNTLRVLNRHGRLDLLPAVAARARLDVDRAGGRRRVTVRTAVALDDAQKASLTTRLSALIGGATPLLHLEVDPALIAGMVVQVGDDVFDSSARTRLKRLRERLIERKGL